MRYFKFVGDPENYPETDLLVNGNVYVENKAIYLHNEFGLCSVTLGGPLFKDSFIDVTEEHNEEQEFINQCAIEAMNGFISGANQFYDIRSQEDICEASWNLAERMNEERKKRLKKSSS